MKRLDALLTPAEIREWAQADQSGAVCVVFDVFRATSTILAMIGAGAESVWPADDIPGAMALHAARPGALLAGERGGVRIGPELTGGVAFDLGNSPREFTPETVRGRPVIITTTNGSRALHACRRADAVLACSFGNLGATADWLSRHPAERVVLVAAGTGERAALEDTLGAGALADRLNPDREVRVGDAVLMARALYRSTGGHPGSLAATGRNGARLLAIRELADDVAWCLQPDRFAFAVAAKREGGLRLLKA